MVSLQVFAETSFSVVDITFIIFLRMKFNLSDDKWLDAVNYSLSPTGEIFTFAHAEKIVILGTKWDNSRDHNIFKILWKGEIDNPNLLITSVLSIPVVAQSTSTQVKFGPLITHFINKYNVRIYFDCRVQLTGLVLSLVLIMVMCIFIRTLDYFCTLSNSMLNQCEVLKGRAGKIQMRKFTFRIRHVFALFKGVKFSHF